MSGPREGAREALPNTSGASVPRLPFSPQPSPPTPLSHASLSLPNPFLRNLCPTPRPPLLSQALGDKEEAAAWQKKLVRLKIPIGERQAAVMRKQQSIKRQITGKLSRQGSQALSRQGSQALSRQGSK